MKRLLLSFCAVLFAVAALADKTVIFDATTDYTADAKVLVLSKDGITLSIGEGTLANKSEYRFYKNKDVTLTADAGKIKKVVFTCTAKDGAKYGPGCFTVTDGEYTYKDYEGNWTGNAAQVVFTATTNQVRATKVEVTVEETETFEIASPTFSCESGNYKDEQAVTITAPAGYGIIYTTDGTTPAEGVGTAVATNTVEIKVTESTTIKAITVDNSDPDNHSAVASVTIQIYHELGSLEAPLTITEAQTFIDANVGLNNTYVFTKGTIYQIDQFNSTATYWITDASNNVLEVYSGYALGNVPFTSADELGVGDVVTVYGTLTKYKDIYEYNSKNYIVAHDKSGRTASLETFEPLALSAFNNFGFETWTDDVCDLWKANSTASNATLKQSTDAHSGSYSILIEGADANMRLASTEITVPAGCYLITFYAKAVETSAAVRVGYVPATLNEAKTSYKLGTYTYFYNNKNVEVGTEWTEIKAAFKLEEETTLSLLVMNPKGQGDVLVDDFTFTTTTEEEAASINAVNAANAEGAIFNLAGQKVSNSFKGIVIKNGKKVLVK